MVEFQEKFPVASFRNETTGNFSFGFKPVHNGESIGCFFISICVHGKEARTLYRGT
jgi:hypothetical protein